MPICSATAVSLPICAPCEQHTARDSSPNRDARTTALGTAYTTTVLHPHLHPRHRSYTQRTSLSPPPFQLLHLPATIHPSPQPHSSSTAPSPPPLYSLPHLLPPPPQMPKFRAHTHPHLNHTHTFSFLTWARTASGWLCPIYRPTLESCLAIVLLRECHLTVTSLAEVRRTVQTRASRLTSDAARYTPATGCH